MSKTYEKTFRSMAARGGERAVWEIPWPGECQFTKLIVKQVGGVAVAFRVDLFSARVAVSHSQSSGGSEAEGDYAADPDNYRVIPTQDSDAPGKMMKFLDDSIGHFLNQDVPGSTNRVQKVYVELEAEGAGDMTFDLTLGCVRRVG